MKASVTFEVSYDIVVADKEDVEEVAADIGNVLEYQTCTTIKDTLDGRVSECTCTSVIEVSVEKEEPEEEDFDEEEIDDED